MSVRLRVRGHDGKQQILDVRSVSTAEAVRRAAARGFQVLAVERAETSAASRDKSHRFPLLLFSQELLALLEAGLNLTEALSTLYEKERRPAVRAVLDEVRQALAEGRNFSDVLARRPAHFPDVYVASVRASERTGDLPQALARYIIYQLQFDLIRKKLISAAIYPLMLLSVAGFVTFFLIGYVVPRFSAVYETSGRDIPALSRLLLAFGKAINAHWPIALSLVAAAFGFTVWMFANRRNRAWLLDRVLRLPWLNVKADEFRLARFYRAVSLLLASGIPLPRAMNMVGALLGRRQRDRLTEARTRVEQGHMLSAALVATALASPVAESLIRVGERSGQLADMLDRTARFHDEEFSRWVDWASRLLEPVLMTAIGLVIGIVVVLLYMPVFDLAGSLQ